MNVIYIPDAVQDAGEKIVNKGKEKNLWKKEISDTHSLHSDHIKNNSMLHKIP